MSDQNIKIGDRISVYLDSKNWISEGWFDGVVIEIKPQTDHRSFYFVQLDVPVKDAQGRLNRVITVFNPKNFKKI